MVVYQERCRVLVAANAPERAILLPLFAGGQLEGWQALEAAGSAQAQFLLQHDSADLVLVDGAFAWEQEREALVRLALRKEVPVVLLASPGPESASAVCRQVAARQLPRDLAVARPELLNEALHQAVSADDLQRDRRQVLAALQECRERIAHLAALLWEAVPTTAPAPWYTQRAMLDRLQEEVARAERYHLPLSVALGEIPAGEGGTDTAAARQWVVDRMLRAKRRSDVAGQYGPHGFMLLLPCTPESGAAVACRRLEDLLEQSGDQEPGGPQGGPSRAAIGFASYSEVLADPRSLLSRAEELLEKGRH